MEAVPRGRLFLLNNAMIYTKKTGNQVQYLDGDRPGELIRAETQTITDEFMEEIEMLRKLNEAKGRIGDTMHVARVPGWLHRKWVREGFDPTTANEDDFDALIKNLRELRAMLQKQGFDKFIIDKRTF